MHHLIKRSAIHPRLQTDSIRADGARPRTRLSSPPAAPAPPGPRAGAAAPRPVMLRRPPRSAPPRTAPAPPHPAPCRAAARRRLTPPYPAAPPPAPLRAPSPAAAGGCPARRLRSAAPALPGTLGLVVRPPAARSIAARSPRVSECLPCPVKADGTHVQTAVIAPHLWLVVMRAQGE